MPVSLGFEFEFLAPRNMDIMSQQFAANGIKSEITLPDRIQRYDRWWLVPDGSIRRDGFDGTSMELVSPVYGEAEGFEVMNHTFGVMELLGCATNQSCGFHVGIGHDDIRRMDPLKLVLFLNEHKWLQSFDRTRNQYCKSLRLALDRNIRRSLVDHNRKLESVNELRNCLVWNKYYSVNLTKMGKGYLEFRIIGGDKYHLKTGLVNKAVKHFTECVEIASDPSAESERYGALLDKLKNSQDWVLAQKVAQQNS
jgi:hypothetical protein